MDFHSIHKCAHNKKKESNSPNKKISPKKALKPSFNLNQHESTDVQKIKNEERFRQLVPEFYNKKHEGNPLYNKLLNSNDEEDNSILIDKPQSVGIAQILLKKLQLKKKFVNK